MIIMHTSKANKSTETKSIHQSNPIAMTNGISKQWEFSPVQLRKRNAYHGAAVISKNKIPVMGEFGADFLPMNSFEVISIREKHHCQGV